MTEVDKVGALIAIVIVLFPIVFICVKYYNDSKHYKKNLELINTVTSVNRGTSSERLDSKANKIQLRLVFSRIISF